MIILDIVINTMNKMKKSYLIFVLIGLTLKSQAQVDSIVELEKTGVLTWLKSESVKKEAPICAMLFLAGAADGLSQDLLFHYNEFERTTGFENHQYWDPDISWRNKYKNGDPNAGAKFFGSTTFLVGLTDGYHASRSFRDIMIITSLATSDKGVTKKEIATKMAIYTICYGSGFTLVYDYLIK